MATFGLRTAAHQAGTSKSTILRAIQTGRLSATRLEDGGYSIDPAELFRVYPPKSSTDADHPVDHSMGQDTPSPQAVDVTELRIRNAELEAELKALRTILENEKQRVGEERQRAADIKAERDRWHEQAQRLLLVAPPQQPMQAQGWWPFRRSA